VVPKAQRSPFCPGSGVRWLSRCVCLYNTGTCRSSFTYGWRVRPADLRLWAKTWRRHLYTHLSVSRRLYRRRYPRRPGVGPTGRSTSRQPGRPSSIHYSSLSGWVVAVQWWTREADASGLDTGEGPPATGPQGGHIRKFWTPTYIRRLATYVLEPLPRHNKLTIASRPPLPPKIIYGLCTGFGLCTFLNKKFYKGHVTQTTPFHGKCFIPAVGLAVDDPLAEFKECNLIHSRNVEGGLKFLKRVTWPRPRPFHWKFFTPAMGLSIEDPLATFKECSFICSRNIEGGLKFLKGSCDQDNAFFRGNFYPCCGTWRIRPTCQIWSA